MSITPSRRRHRSRDDRYTPLTRPKHWAYEWSLDNDVWYYELTNSGVRRGKFLTMIRQLVTPLSPTNPRQPKFQRIICTCAGFEVIYDDKVQHFVL